MFRRHWGKLVALAGLTLTAASLWSSLAEQSRYEKEAQNWRADYAQRAAEQIRQTCLIPARVADQAKCLKQRAAEYRLQARDKTREQYDLVAQRGSALWAGIMGVVAIIGTGLSVIGIALVWTTFQETKRTNLIAMRENARSTRRAVASGEETAKALAIAERNADAAAKQAAVAEVTAQQQLRAYIAIKDVTMAPDPSCGSGTIRATAHFINVGQTPAKNLNSFMRFVITPINLTPTPEQTFPEPLDTHSRVVLGPNIPNMITHTVVYGTVEAHTVLTGDYTLVVDGYIHYDDIFDKPHRTCFRYYQNAETRGLGNAIVSAPAGNSLT